MSDVSSGKWAAFLGALFSLSLAALGTPSFSGGLALAQDVSLRQDGAAPLIEAVRSLKDLNFCGEKVPMENQDVKERMEKEFLTILGDTAQVILWQKRGARYLPYIEESLKERGMPDDLKYIPFIESSMRAHVGSPKGAVGFWQFIKPTGDKYGLEVGEDVDERRNFQASTEAALDYLQKLYKQFGSWALAAAAYNMGEFGLGREMTFQNNSDFYQLFLPQETQCYVPRIICAKVILSNPGRFGLALNESDLYPPLEFDVVQINLARPVPATLVAQAAHTTFKVIKDLNPQFLGHHMAAGSWDVAIPSGESEGFAERFASLASQPYTEKEQAPEKERFKIHIVKKGDTLFGIAARYKVPLKSILSWNKLGKNQRLRLGDRLIVDKP